jgi:hypothetical protein
MDEHPADSEPLLDEVLEAPRRKRVRLDASPRPESRRQMQRRLKRPAHRPRNPHLEQRFRPSDQDKRVVQLLAGFAIPRDRICWAVVNPHTRRPITTDTLAKYFETELSRGRAEVDQLLADGLSKRLREANMTALVWCSKNLWNWADHVVQDGKGTSVDLSITIKPEDIAAELRRRNLPPEVFGYDTPPPLDETPMIEHVNGLDHEEAGDA